MKQQVIFNGRMRDAEKPVAAAADQGLRYGYGCFETLRLAGGKICLRDAHFARLFASLELLQMEVPAKLNAAALEKQVIRLAEKNGHQASGRVRLNFFGGPETEGRIGAQYLVESSALGADAASFNQAGLVLDIYRDARIAADQFSHIKHNNFLPYRMAARWAAVHQLDDAIVLNTADRLADTSIANLFLVCNGVIKTPVLTEGCIAGVMRKYLINRCRKEGIPVEETQLTADDLQEAGEVFVTNAIKGISWVRQISDWNYSCQVSQLLHRKFIKPLWC